MKWAISLPAMSQKGCNHGEDVIRKLFDAHVVYEAQNETPLLYIDRHLVHEVTSPQAFDGLRAHGRQVR